MYLNQKKVNSKNILEVLSSSVLIRYLKVGNEEFKKITYKKKSYRDGNVMSETKINVNIDDIDKAYNLFRELNFEKIVDVNYDVVVYEKEGYELAFQNVEGLGLLLEVENPRDFTGVNDETIIAAKQKMLVDIQNLGLKTSENLDVKKAFELIKLRLKEKDYENSR